MAVSDSYTFVGLFRITEYPKLRFKKGKKKFLGAKISLKYASLHSGGKNDVTSKQSSGQDLHKVKYDHI